MVVEEKEEASDPDPEKEEHVSNRDPFANYLVGAPVVVLIFSEMWEQSHRDSGLMHGGHGGQGMNGGRENGQGVL